MPHDSDTRNYLVVFAVVLLLLQAPIPGFAQSDRGTLTEADEVAGQTFRLDPTLDIATPTLESAVHTPLPEQYIWSGETGDAGETTFLYFRKTFALKAAPRVATLYAAGPNWMMVYLNGRQLANGFHDPKERIRPFVLAH